MAIETYASVITVRLPGSYYGEGFEDQDVITKCSFTEQKRARYFRHLYIEIILFLHEV